MMRPSFTVILSACFLAYIGHSMWTIYGLFYPEECPENGQCLRPYLRKKPNLELRIYTSIEPVPKRRAALDLLWKNDTFYVHDVIEKDFNVTLPLKTRNNGSLYVHAFLLPLGESPFTSPRAMFMSSRLTTYTVPKAEAFSLLGESSNGKEAQTVGSVRQPVTHWRSKLVFNVVTQEIAFPRHSVPLEILRHIKLVPGTPEYLPILYIDELSYRTRDLLPVNQSSEVMPLTISYSPISVGKLRLWTNFQESINMLHKLGFTEKDTDEVKGIFADTNLYFLMLTFFVSAVHLLFDFLAFKNDISFWRSRDSMVGLSTRVVVWRCVSTIIIFLYLLDEETSLLVLIPTGIGAVIEVWKVKKAFKVSWGWKGWRPSFKIGTASEKERETEQFDSQAMKYLSYLLYPLVLAGAVYSLVYNPHKSWYSWCVQSAVNGVYAFGFLFMLPQLFVNYKLKSVAHLPWRAFMYKAFNTFIDDIFAFIITMPTAHRVACFRDDVVFLVYLYQRWLYPVDKTRVNEYGQSFEETDSKESKKTK